MGDEAAIVSAFQDIARFKGMCMKTRRFVRKCMLVAATGGILLQTVTCTDSAIFVTAVSQVVTAGSALIILRRIITE